MTVAQAAARVPERVARAGRILARVALHAGALVLLALLVLTCVDVAGRYLLDAPVNGKTELTRFLMAGLIACALPVVSASGEQITVDLLDRWFTGRAGAIRDFAVDAVCAAALVVLTHWLLFRAARLMKRGYVSDFLELPLHPVAYFVAAMVGVSAAALVVRVLVDAWYVAHPEQRPARRAAAGVE